VVGRCWGIAFGQCCLHLGRTSDRVDDAGEFDQEAVAGGLDDAAAMLCDLSVDDFGPECLEPAEGPFLVGFDQARMAGDVGREDRREPTFDASLPCGLHRTSLVADDPTPTSAPRTLSKEGDTPEAKRDAPGWRAWLLASPMS
jgi:hypothetical protein